MLPRSVHDRAELAELLRRDPVRHAYELGDLDDFFWPYTTWYRLDDTVALIYHGAGFPTLLCFDGDPERAAALVAALRPLLPARFYAHLSVGAESSPGDGYRAEPGGLHLKLALTEPALLEKAIAEGGRLDADDLPDLLGLYAAAYPGNWFDQRMLETGQYVGVRRDGRLVAVAGIHVWSPVYRVAALGNVTTHPAYRGQGLATASVAALCRQLRDSVDHITLNVKADNVAALAVYRRLGFTEVARYHEVSFSILD